MTHVTPAMITSERLNRNWSQKRLAKEASVSPKTISRLEDGETVRPDTWIQVLSALGFPTTRRAHRIPDASLGDDRTEEVLAAFSASRPPLNSDLRSLLAIAALISAIVVAVPTCVWLFTPGPHDVILLCMTSMFVGIGVFVFAMRPFVPDTIVNVVTSREPTPDVLNRLVHAVTKVVGDTVSVVTVSTYNDTYSIRLVARLPKVRHASALYRLRSMGLMVTVASRF